MKVKNKNVYIVQKLMKMDDPQIHCLSPLDLIIKLKLIRQDSNDCTGVGFLKNYKLLKIQSRPYKYIER